MEVSSVAKKQTLKDWYGKLPKEVKVFVEYILPSAIITAAIDYFGTLEINNEYVLAGVNLLLIFLRNVKPRYQSLRK